MVLHLLKYKYMIFISIQGGFMVIEVSFYNQKLGQNKRQIGDKILNNRRCRILRSALCLPVVSARINLQHVKQWGEQNQGLKYPFNAAKGDFSSGKPRWLEFLELRTIEKGDIAIYVLFSEDGVYLLWCHWLGPKKDFW